MPATTDLQPISLPTKLFIAIIISTVTMVTAVVGSYYKSKEELYDAINRVNTENKIQELKFENLKLEVERNRISLERMREEIRDGRL